MDILDFFRKGGAFPASVGWEPEPEGALGISGAHKKEGQDSQPLTLEPAYAIFVLFFPACLYLRCTLGSLNLPETLDKGIGFLSSVCNECKISEVAAGGGGSTHTCISKPFCRLLKADFLVFCVSFACGTRNGQERFLKL